MTMRMTGLSVAGALWMLGAGCAVAQDTGAGENLYQQVCRNCHGPEAQGMASFPALASSPPEHIVMRLEQYRGGEIVGPNTALMRPHAAGLSDDDIANLSAYIGSL